MKLTQFITGLLLIGSISGTMLTPQSLNAEETRAPITVNESMMRRLTVHDTPGTSMAKPTGALTANVTNLPNLIQLAHLTHEALSKKPRLALLTLRTRAPIVLMISPPNMAHLTHAHRSAG